MGTTTFDSPEALRDKVGQEVGVSDWFAIDQSRIVQFAEATEDRQWIHIDSERAAQESPYGTTIAHGFLTLSLLSFFSEQTVRVQGVKMGVNYGLNRVRFPSAVPTNGQIRARFVVQAFEEVPGGVQITWGVTIELQGAQKPCCIAEWLIRLYV